MSEHRLRFGITHSGTNDPAAWVADARRAEELGYGTLLLPDTLRTPAPLPALAAAAAVTERLRVGTWVLCEPLRPPGLLAWEAATVQALSGGRFELGIGAGRPDAAADAAALGLAFGSPAERVQQLTRTIGLLRERLPDTPLLVAASGPRLLRLAARLGDTVALGWPPTTTIAQARERVDMVRTVSAGVELATGLIAVGEAAQPWLQRMGTDARTLAEQGAVGALVGSVAQMVERVLQLRDELGVSYFTVPVSAMTDFAPVVAELAGR